jgi:hypothetical protein
MSHARYAESHPEADAAVSVEEPQAPVEATPVGTPPAGLPGELKSPDVSPDDAGAAAPVDRRQQQHTPRNSGERRQNMVDRRCGLERRVVDIGSPTGLERRRGPGRRRTDDRRSAEEGEMTDEQFEFVLAIDTYKRLNSRPFPTWTEILEVVKQLGYRKVAASTLALTAATPRSQTQAAPVAAAPVPLPRREPVPPSEFLPG